MSKKKLLIIEDESSVAKQLKWSLNDIYAITIAPNASKARGFLSSGEFAVATLDLGLPPSPDSPEQGLKLLQEVPDFTTATKIIVITGNTEQEIALQAVALGAHDFCSKPINVEMLKVILDRAFVMHALETTNRQLQEQTMACGGLRGMIGISNAMQRVFQLIQKNKRQGLSGLDYRRLGHRQGGGGQYHSSTQSPFVKAAGHHQLRCHS